MLVRNRIEMETNESAVLSLLSAPKVPLHSKIGLIHNMLSKQKQNSDLLRIKDDLARLSYTSKVIGAKGSDVSIVSKRLFMSSKSMKEKKIDIVPKNPSFNRDYVVHKNFFVNPLAVGRKEPRERSCHRPDNFLLSLNSCSL